MIGQETNPLSSNPQAFASFSMQSMMTRNWMGTLQPLKEFIHPSNFSIPMSLVDAAKRMEFNLTHFMSNYAIVFMVAFLYAIIFRPSFLFLLTFLAGVGYFVLYKSDQIHIGEYKLQGKAKSMLFFAVATTLTFFFAGAILFGILTFSCAVILIHSILHGSLSDPNHAQLHAASAAIVASAAAKLSDGVAMAVREGKAVVAAATASKNAGSGNANAQSAPSSGASTIPQSSIDTAGDMELTSLKANQGDMTDSDLELGTQL